MKPIGIVWVAASLFLLSSCGSSDTEADATPITQATAGQPHAMSPESRQILEKHMERLQKEEAAMYPCNLFSQQQIESMLSDTPDKNHFSLVHTYKSDKQYKRAACDWSLTGNEIELWVSLPKYFSSGKVKCIPGDTNLEISALGHRAWWDYQERIGMGTLRVCSSKAMLEVKIDMAKNDEAKAKTIAMAIAGKLLAAQ